MRTRFRTAPSWTGALLLAVAAACAERDTPVAPAEPEPAPPAQLARLECRADVREREVTCSGVHVPGDARGLIVGGQNVYTRLVSSNALYDAGTEIFSFDVTVANLIPQPMATLDGTTPSGSGVQVFFHSGPVVTSGTGTISVANPDGVGTFTGSNQPYYLYSGTMLGPDEILSQNEVSSAKRWQFAASPNIGFSFVVYISADVPYPNGWIEVEGTPQVLSGGTRTLTATVFNSVGDEDPQPVTWSSSNTSMATVSSAGVVTGVAPGKATITATSGARVGSLEMQVCNNSLAVGGTLSFAMPGDATLCFGGQASGAEYVVIPMNQGGTDVPLNVTATGIVPVFGSPNPTRIPNAGAALRGSAAHGEAAFERDLRGRERRELAGLLRAGRRHPSALLQARPRWNLVPGTPIVGDLMDLNVKATSFCANADVRTGRVAAVGTHVVVLADTANPAGGFTTMDYQEIAASFDTLVWPTLTGAFGPPGDEDGNERVALFFTRAVNQLTPTGGAYTASFFLSRDLLSTFACPTSNVGELIYLAVPDPSGTINGNTRATTFVKDRAIGAVGHDLQHLLNASHRLYASAPPEETWLNEGLSGIAEELLFYAASGKAPRQNLGLAQLTQGIGAAATVRAFNAYADPNFRRLREMLMAPHVRNPAIDSAAHSGAWAFLRYAADRLNGNDLTFWNALANSSTTGMTNLQAALGANDAGLWMRDFTVALYADDALPGSYSLPSWNYRSLYNALDYNGDGFADGYPLAVRNPSAGVADAFTLSADGGAAYLRMGVSSGGIATVSITSNGAAPPSSVPLIVIRRK